MADLNLNELRKVAEAATPGPWLRNPDDECEVLAENHDPLFPDFPFEFVITDCNGKASISEPDFAHIIAFHPPTVLALLDRVTELEAVLARVEALCAGAWWTGEVHRDDIRAALRGESDE